MTLSVPIDRRAFLATLAPAVAGLTASVASLRPSARAVVLIVHAGAPGQLDTWDPKPAAPAEVRGPFRVARTAVPGVLFSELLPRSAALADKMTVVRTVTGGTAPGHLAGLLGVRRAALRTLGPVEPTGTPAANRTQRRTPEADRYGDSAIGRQLFDARRRVEAGARFVTVNHTTADVPRGMGWDAHTAAGLAAVRDRVAPEYDTAYAALLTDLEGRGLLESTVVVGLGEFGREPKLNVEGGRHHWTGCWSATLAGGGFPAGAVIGRSDDWAAEPADGAVGVEDLFGWVADRLGTRVPDARGG